MLLLLNADREPGDRDGHCAREGKERASGPRWIRVPAPAQRVLQQRAGPKRGSAERDPTGEARGVASTPEQLLATILERAEPFV